MVSGCGPRKKGENKTFHCPKFASRINTVGVVYDWERQFIEPL
jgi:hypothetical protein